MSTTELLTPIAGGPIELTHNSALALPTVLCLCPWLICLHQTRLHQSLVCPSSSPAYIFGEYYEPTLGHRQTHISNRPRRRPLRIGPVLPHFLPLGVRSTLAGAVSVGKPPAPVPRRSLSPTFVSGWSSDPSHDAQRICARTGADALLADRRQALGWTMGLSPPISKHYMGLHQYS